MHLFSRASIIIAFILRTVYAQCQEDEIYRLTFSDTSNFNLENFLGHQIASRQLILDITDVWDVRRFWIGNIKNDTFSTDEHNPYNTIYLFKDSLLNNLIGNDEKKYLTRCASRFKSSQFRLQGNHYKTIHNVGRVRGYYVTTTRPVFSENGQYAFIDLTIFYKATINEKLSDSYFGTICVIYKKGIDSVWQKLYTKRLLLL